MIKNYTKYIAKSRRVIYFSIIIALIWRVYFLTSFAVEPNLSTGYVWTRVNFLFSNNYAAALIGTLLVGILGLLAAFLNKSHNLIRRRTYLPFAFTLLLLSSAPLYLCISSELIALFFFVISCHILFSSYMNKSPQRQTFDISFILSLGSLCQPALLVLIPLFWIGSIMMRSFNFKAFISSLLAILMVYFSVFCYFVLTNNLAAFYAPIRNETFQAIPILSMNLVAQIWIGIILFLLITIMVNNSMNSFKDKIKTRALISFFNFIALATISLYLFSPISSNLFLFVSLFTSGMVLAHFFSLANTKWKIGLFYLLLLLYFLFPFVGGVITTVH